MDTLNNYIATHLREDAELGRIAQLRLLARNEDGEFEDRELIDRAEIIALLKEGHSIYAWDYENENIGESIDLIGVQGDIYLRIDEKRLCADNLGALPSV